MINSKYHTERKYKGKQIIIDIAKLPGDIYEVMTLEKNSGKDLASFQTRDMEKAIRVYRQMLKDYPDSPAELTGKYAKLRDDLREALTVARKAYDANPEDGGACNFDSSAIALPRWNESKVKQAAAEAGTNCFTWPCWGSRRFVFSPNVPAQGNARSRAAEAMTRTLVMLDYDAMDYCQLD